MIISTQEVTIEQVKDQYKQVLESDAFGIGLKKPQRTPTEHMLLKAINNYLATELIEESIQRSDLKPEVAIKKFGEITGHVISSKDEISDPAELRFFYILSIAVNTALSF